MVPFPGSLLKSIVPPRSSIVFFTIASPRPIPSVFVEKFGWQFRVRDKVIQTENDYDKEVFNGDIGQVEKIDPVEREVTVTAHRLLRQLEQSLNVEPFNATDIPILSEDQVAISGVERRRRVQPL